MLVAFAGAEVPGSGAATPQFVPAEVAPRRVAGSAAHVVVVGDLVRQLPTPNAELLRGVPVALHAGHGGAPPLESTLVNEVDQVSHVEELASARDVAVLEIEVVVAADRLAAKEAERGVAADAGEWMGE